MLLREFTTIFLKVETKNCTRKLKIKDYIFWDHWINAFKWDHDKNPFPIHRKLTYDHFYLTSESKMCHHLAEQCFRH